MGHTRTPWTFPNDVPDASGAGRHPLSGAPLSVVELLGADLATGSIYSYANHFQRWEGPVAEGAAGGWLLNGPTGAATIVMSAENDGAIVMTTDATAGGVCNLSLGVTTVHTPFRYTVGKRMGALARVKGSTVASMEWFMGFCTPDTSPTTTGTFPSDGIFLEKAATALDLDFHARQDGTSTEKTAALGLTLADATYVTIGFLVDRFGNVTPYSGTTAKTAKTIPATDTNLPDAAGDAMTFQIGFLGNAMTLTVDWLAFWAEY